jgi:hypothetical protein
MANIDHTAMTAPPTIPAVAPTRNARLIALPFLPVDNVFAPDTSQPHDSASPHAVTDMYEKEGWMDFSKRVILHT